MFDDNARHIAAWNGGHSPVFEPGLSELVADVKGESTDALVGVCVCVCACLGSWVGLCGFACGVCRAYTHPLAPRLCVHVRVHVHTHMRAPVQAYSIVYVPAHFGQGGGFWVAGKNLSFTTDFKSMIDRAEVIFVSVRARCCAALAHYRPPRAAPSRVCCGAARRLATADAAEACGHAEPRCRLGSARLGSARRMRHCGSAGELRLMRRPSSSELELGRPRTSLHGRRGAPAPQRPHLRACDRTRRYGGVDSAWVSVQHAAWACQVPFQMWEG